MVINAHAAGHNLERKLMTVELVQCVLSLF